MLPDQVPPEGMGVWAPFFGQPAYTMTLAARLAQQSGAALAVLWCERLPSGAGYVVHAQPLAAAARRRCRRRWPPRTAINRVDGGRDPPVPDAVPVGLPPLQGLRPTLAVAAAEGSAADRQAAPRRA